MGQATIMASGHYDFQRENRRDDVALCSDEREFGEERDAAASRDQTRETNRSIGQLDHPEVSLSRCYAWEGSRELGVKISGSACPPYITP